jgi:hypothetical protein
MQRIDVATAVGVKPDPDPTGTPGYFAKAPPGSGVAPTVLTADWANGVQEEIVQTILGAGLGLSKDDNTQLLQAVQSLVGSSAVVGAGALFGLTLANAAAAPTTKITISAGLTRDSTNTAGMALAAPITKDLTAAWAAGDGAGGRDTGALANGQTWHVHLIKNPAAGVVDALFSQSPTAPTLPAGFSKFRRLGAIVLDAAATTIRKFRQDGDDFEYDVRSVDYANQSNTTVPALRSIAVPVGVSVDAQIYFQSNGTIDNNPYLSGLFNPLHGVPSMGGSTQWAQVRRIAGSTPGGSQYSYGTVVCRCRTDTNGKIYSLSNDTTDIIAIGVLGWRDTRGRFF